MTDGLLMARRQASGCSSFHIKSSSAWRKKKLLDIRNPYLNGCRQSAHVLSSCPVGGRQVPAKMLFYEGKRT